MFTLYLQFLIFQSYTFKTLFSISIISSIFSVQMGILGIHPDLAGRLAQQGQLSRESTREQSSVGLDKIDQQTLRRIAELNMR